jgi:hypothetical protein
LIIALACLLLIDIGGYLTKTWMGMSEDPDFWVACYAEIYDKEERQ